MYAWTGYADTGQLYVSTEVAVMGKSLIRLVLVIGIVSFFVGILQALLTNREIFDSRLSTSTGDAKSVPLEAVLTEPPHLDPTVMDAVPVLVHRFTKT